MKVSNIASEQSISQLREALTRSSERHPSGARRRGPQELPKHHIKRATPLSPLSYAPNETRYLSIDQFIIPSIHKEKNQRTVTVDIDGAKRRWTACPPVARLAPSPPFAARFKNLKRTEAEAGPARGLPPLAGERQRADRPDFCGATICGFFIAGCTVDPNHHCSAKRALASRPREPYQIGCPVALPGRLRAWTRAWHSSSSVSAHASTMMARRSRSSTRRKNGKFYMAES